MGCKEPEVSYPTLWNDPPPPSRSWTAVTPAGINLITDTATIDQYEVFWQGNFHWEGIDWEVVDKEFALWKQYYCYDLNLDCKHTVPSDLTLYIKPWDSRCVDAETPEQPQEICEYINGEWQCIDGWYWERVIYFHLGDDPGVNHVHVSDDGLSSITYGAFQESAYSHELLHFFQDMAGFTPSDIVYYPPGWMMILPGEDIKEEVDEGKQ